MKGGSIQFICTNMSISFTYSTEPKSSKSGYMLSDSAEY